MSCNQQLEHRDTVIMLLPQYEILVHRLEKLAQQPTAPVITVMGKYNHGKSRLLNELIGAPCFAVADKRETVVLQRAEHNGVVWLDAPGLDADVDQKDDQQAEQALWVESDIRLVVHAVKEGELDASELELIAQLVKDREQTQRQFFLVLTQIDQVADETALEHIVQQLRQQLGQMEIYPVSSVRYRKGMDDAISVFVEKSGIPALLERLELALQAVPAARQFEQRQYFSLLVNTILEKQAQHQARQKELSEQAQQEEINFSQDLHRTLEQIAEDLWGIMQEPKVDQALNTDTIHDVFKITAAKQERSRLQVAYSRACIRIRSVLTQYGVAQLPKTKQVGAASLNTVMVAVLGVSVKYRADLRRLFGTAEGRERLFQGFKSYFDASEGRLHRLSKIARQHALCAQVDSALAAVRSWEEN